MKEVLTLDGQRRLYVSRELFAAIGIEIPKGETVELWALIGALDQLQLLPRDAQASRLRDRFKDQNIKAEWDAAADDNVSIFTQLQSFLLIPCKRTTRAKVQVTLPAEAVKLGLVTDRGVVVILTNGRILQVWDRDIWKQAAKITDLRAFTEHAEQLLEEVE